MNSLSKWRPRRLRFTSTRYIAIPVVAFALIFINTAFASTKLSIDGYLDFSYPGTIVEPTEGRSEHKLWYHDGLWWAVMYSTGESAYTIHKLNWDSQTWVDTQVWVDERVESRSDTLWDGTKLYIATHFKQENPSPVSSPANWGRLYRYSYNDTTDTYSLDTGFPVVGITEDKTKTLSLAQDSTGRLWVAYVSRPSGSSSEYQVYVRSSGADDLTWNAPVPLTSTFATEALTASHDIAGLIAFEDNGGAKLGIMWSNESTGVDQFYFATHPDSSADSVGWVMDAATIPYLANDHISLAKTSTGQVLTALKTSSAVTGETLNAVVTRDLDGSYSFHKINPVESLDTKPIIVVYEPSSGPDKAYVFMTSNSAGGVICVVEAEITTPLSSMSFSAGNCGSESIGQPRIVLGDESVYTEINNASTTRQILDENSDIVVLASDQVNDVYVHTVVLNPLPGVIKQSPEPGQHLNAAEVIISATFDMPMDDSTINGSSFQVLLDSTPIAGVVSYNPANLTATFTPDASLAQGVEYTVMLANTIQNAEGVNLLDAPVTWTFTTEPEFVTDTPTPTATDTPTPTASDTPTPTATDSPTPTASDTPTPTATDTPTPTASDTPTPTATASDTPTPTATASDTPTPTATASDTPTPTPTATPTPEEFFIYLPLVLK